jgi:hypothetical protein
MQDRGRGQEMLRGAVLLAGVATLAACASIGPELQPGRRAVSGQWMVSLHQQPGGRYQVLVQHPSGRFNGPPGAVRCRLDGDPMRPYTWGIDRTETRAEGPVSHSFTLEKDRVTIEAVPERVIVERRDEVRTTWDFDRARWLSGRPFRLVITPAFGLPDEVVLEIALGPEPGRSDGIELRHISGRQ